MTAPFLVPAFSEVPVALPQLPWRRQPFKGRFHTKRINGAIIEKSRLQGLTEPLGSLRMNVVNITKCDANVGT